MIRIIFFQKQKNFANSSNFSTFKNFLYEKLEKIKNLYIIVKL